MLRVLRMLQVTGQSQRTDRAIRAGLRRDDFDGSFVSSVAFEHQRLERRSGQRLVLDGGPFGGRGVGDER